MVEPAWSIPYGSCADKQTLPNHSRFADWVTICVPLPKRAGLNTASDQTVRAVHSCNSWLCSCALPTWCSWDWFNRLLFISGFHHQIKSGSLMNSRNFQVWPMFIFLNVISALASLKKGKSAGVDNWFRWWLQTRGSLKDCTSHCSSYKDEAYLDR